MLKGLTRLGTKILQRRVGPHWFNYFWSDEAVIELIRLTRDKLQDAAIDLPNVMATAKRLNSISAQKYLIDDAQL